MPKFKESEQLPEDVAKIKLSIQTYSQKYPVEPYKCEKDISQQWHCHQQKMRWFFVISLRVVYSIHCVVFRWKCSICGVTFTNLPSICVGQKFYLREEVEERSQDYLETPRMTYRQAVKDDGNEIVYHKEEKDVATSEWTDEQKEKEENSIMAHTTVYRWIRWIADASLHIQPVVRKAVSLDTRGDLSFPLIASIKYRSDERKIVLQCACSLLRAKNRGQLKNPTRYAPRGASP